MQEFGIGWATVLAVGLAVAWLAYGLKPLHDSRQGHRAAAEWLAENAAAADRVVDTRGWTGLYSDGVVPLAMYMKEIAAEEDGAQRLRMATEMAERMRRSGTQSDLVQAIYDVGELYAESSQTTNAHMPDQQPAPGLP